MTTSRQRAFTHLAYLEPLDFFVLRSPTRSIQALTALFERPDFEQALLDFFAQPLAREALYIGSSSLYRSLLLLEKQEPISKREKVVLALGRYATRMCSRATPFGLFAGITAGSIGNKSSLHLCDDLFASARLDAEVAFSIAKMLAEKPAIRRRIRWYPNSTLYNVNGSWRYIEYRSVDGARQFQLSSVEGSTELNAALNLAASGSTFSELESVVRSLDNDCESSEIQEFLENLVSWQLLCADIEPPVTGAADALSYLIDYLARWPTEFGVEIELLRKLNGEIRSVERGIGVDAIASLQRASATAGAILKDAPEQVAQVDLRRAASSEFELGKELADEVAAVVSLLGRVNGREDGELGAFRDAFVERYGCRLVPLLEVLDEDCGIGFGPKTTGSALLRQIGIAAPSPRARDRDTPWNALLSRKLEEAWRNSSQEILLSAAEVLPLAVHQATEEGRTCAAILEPFFDSSSSRVRVNLKAVTRRSVAEVLGRFCHLDDALLERLSSAAKEEGEAARPALVADVYQLPRDRLLNVASHPHIRELEIPCLCRSGADPARQVHLADILVTVRGGRIHLHSRSLGAELLPLSSDALRMAGLGLTPLQRFLGKIQIEGTNDCSFHWPGSFGGFEFLPRMRIGRVVLASAYWRIKSQEVTALSRAAPAEQRRALDAMRAAKGLPRWVHVGDIEQCLTLDLESPLGIALLLSEARKYPYIMIRESFVHTSCITSPDGVHAGEIILPLRARSSQSAITPAATRSELVVERATTVVRSFMPGSEWLYVKVYCSPRDADIILASTIRGAAHKLLTEGHIRKWFFIRFEDPYYHLRLRMQLSEVQSLSSSLGAVHSTLTSSLPTEVWKLQLDTYEREIFRYGGAQAIELCESWFQHDSDCAASLIHSAGDEPEDDYRWKAALYSCHRVLTDFRFESRERSAIVGDLAAGFGSEFSLPKSYVGRASRFYRQLSPELEGLVLHSETGGHLAKALVHVDQRSARVVECVDKLLAAHSRGALTLSIGEIAKSLMHMSINRILATEWRAQEAVLYDFLHRLYDVERLHRKVHGD